MFNILVYDIILYIAKYLNYIEQNSFELVCLHVSKALKGKVRRCVGCMDCAILMCRDTSSNYGLDGIHMRHAAHKSGYSITTFNHGESAIAKRKHISVLIRNYGSCYGGNIMSITIIGANKHLKTIDTCINLYITLMSIRECNNL